MEGGDAEEGLDDAGAGDVGLVEAGLADPAAYVEGVGDADEDVDGGQEKRGCRPGREPPREEGQRKDRHAIGRQGNGAIAEPAAAEGDVAVFLFDIEPMDLPAEQQREEKVGEFVGEGHHPADVPPDAGDDETHEEGGEADAEIQMQPDPSGADRFQSAGLDKHCDGDHQQQRPQHAREPVQRLAGDGLETLPFFLFHTETKIPNPLDSAKNLFTFVSI